MQEVLLLVAGLFLPLFPLSMVFNEVFQRIRGVWMRTVLMLTWPQFGILIANAAGADIPGWIIIWGLLTAVLYAFRALELREVGLWAGFIATSAWAFLWIALDSDTELSRLIYYALGFSVPLALLVLLGAELEKRFGAAYTGLYGGLALTLPRLSGVFVFVILAIVATPVFPGFSVMLAAIFDVIPRSITMAVTIGLVWLLWGWAAARMLQGMLVGPAHEEAASDLSINNTWGYVTVLSLLGIGGIYLIGGLS